MEPEVVRRYDIYHCRGCNVKMGYGVEFSDGSSEETVDVNVDCFGVYITGGSYTMERSE